MVVIELRDCSTMASTKACSWSSVRFMWNLWLCSISLTQRTWKSNLPFIAWIVPLELLKHGSCNNKGLMESCMTISDTGKWWGICRTLGHLRASSHDVDKTGELVLVLPCSYEPCIQYKGEVIFYSVASSPLSWNPPCRIRILKYSNMSPPGPPITWSYTWFFRTWELVLHLNKLGC